VNGYAPASSVSCVRDRSACRLQENLKSARHNNLKMVQLNNLITARHENLIFVPRIGDAMRHG
jgi:hypothetical protein